MYKTRYCAFIRRTNKIHLKCDRASWREPCFAHTPPPPSSDEIPFEYAVRICRHWKHGITPKIYSFQSFPFSPFPSPSPKRDITAIIIIPLLRFVKNQWGEKIIISLVKITIQLSLLIYSIFILYIYIYIYPFDSSSMDYIIPFNSSQVWSTERLARPKTYLTPWNTPRLASFDTGI